jgi:hypothetical protein
MACLVTAVGSLIPHYGRRSASVFFNRHQHLKLLIRGRFNYDKSQIRRHKHPPIHKIIGLKIAYGVLMSP